jgi:hypothetical protein
MWTMTAIGVATLVGARALAVDATGQSTVSKRQMIVQVTNCMRKRMSVDKEISYNAAAKICKNQVNNRSSNSVAVAVLAPGAPAKP